MNKLAISALETMDRDQVSRYALTASIDGGKFEDVKFFVFSRRTNKNKVCAPMPLFGNSTCIRKTAPHFDTVLAEGFSESVLADLNTGYPPGRATVLDRYDYADDSDLEDLEDVEEEKRSKAGKASDDTVSLDDEKDAVEPPDPTISPLNAQVCVSGRPGRIIFIEDMAYQTWRAFVYFAYFGTISFSPLKSQDKSPDKANTECFSPPKCSPKSMYRLANKYDIKDLKETAAKDIQSKLTPNNIFTELFSVFTSLHPEIQELEVQYLRNHLHTPDVVRELPFWITFLAKNKLPEGADKAVTSLISKLITCSKCLREMNYCRYCKATVS